MPAYTDSFQSWDTTVHSWAEIASAPSWARQMPGPIELTVIRHGQTTNNARGLITGASDPPLTIKGLSQASGLRSVLTPSYDLAFHSTLRRSRETLATAIGDREVGAIFDDHRLAERSMGVLEGTPSRPLAAFDHGDLSWAPDGGESYGVVTRRVVSFLLDLFEAGVRAERGLRILVCSHAGTMRILAAVLRCLADPVAILTQKFPNVAPLRFEYRSMEWPPLLDHSGIRS